MRIFFHRIVKNNLAILLDFLATNISFRTNIVREEFLDPESSFLDFSNVTTQVRCWLLFSFMCSFSGIASAAIVAVCCFPKIVFYCFYIFTLSILKSTELLKDGISDTYPGITLIVSSCMLFFASCFFLGGRMQKEEDEFMQM